MRIFEILSACMVMIPATVLGLEPDDSALVGVWLFDEGAGDVVGDLINENDGTMRFSDFQWDDGRFGNAVIASGEGTIAVSSSPSLETITEAVTVAGWFRVDADSETGIRNTGGFLLEDQSTAEPVPDGWSFRIWTTDGLSPGIYGQTELAQGEWYHVAGTYDGELMELYINGEPESALGLLDSSGKEIDPQWSGEIEIENPLFFKLLQEPLFGAMDEVVILSRALEAYEIKQLLDGWSNLRAPESLLEAGDADQDYDFDQLDLVRVQIAGKYLTTQAATWGEGDWNGAPGGERGSPPIGDGLFNQLDIVAAQQAGLYLNGSYAGVHDTFVAVPEPSGFLLTGMGLLGVLARVRRRVR